MQSNIFYIRVSSDIPLFIISFTILQLAVTVVTFNSLVSGKKLHNSLNLITCKSLRRQSIGQETRTFYVDDTQIFLGTHRHEQAVEEAPANPQ